jgi:uncharacterized protein (DUF1501 family)
MSDFLKTRREFLRTTMLGASAAWSVPGFVNRTFAGLDEASRDLAVQGVTGKDGRILVVLQLAGGNDGLNTLVPYADDAYHRLRPRLAQKPGSVKKLNDYCGLNAAMPYFGELFAGGDLAVVQGVGYPNPNRSHFVSTSVWESADPGARATTGWLGRYFDNACSGSDPLGGISLTKTQPESFGAAKNPGICMTTPELYRWLHGGGDRDEAQAFFAGLNRPGGEGAEHAAAGEQAGIQSNLAFLERVALDAQVSSRRILEIASKHKSKVAYDGTPLARSLNLVGRMIAGGLPTRVYYVSHGGFDTHNGQTGNHERLLATLDAALKSFFGDLKDQGNYERVSVMTFSEFGRRAGENASGGTDHGKGSCMFVAGGGVKGGIYGKAPSLEDLDAGDLKFSTDFRSVYATVLEDWLQTKAEPVLGAAYPKLGFVG